MAAKDGFEIVLNNGIRYLVVAGVGKLMMFIGRILIAIGTTLAFYCLITFVPEIKANIIEPLYLLLVLLLLFSDRLHHRVRSGSSLHGSVQFGSRHHFGLLHRRRDEPGSQGRQGGALRPQRAQRPPSSRRLIQLLTLIINILNKLLFILYLFYNNNRSHTYIIMRNSFNILCVLILTVYVSNQKCFNNSDIKYDLA